MTRVSKVYDGTDPGATPGRVFTASIGQETIIPEGNELSYLKMGIRITNSTAPVVLEDVASLLSEYVLRVGAETRLLLDGRDLAALMVFFFKELPVFGENTDNTGSGLLGGIKVPVYAKVDNAKPFTHTATRTAVTNATVETLGITAYFDTEEAGRKPIHAVKITHTTAASAGYQTLSFRIAPVGKLIGLLIRQPNGFDDTNIDVSVQRVRILVNGQLHSQFNALTDFSTMAPIDFVTPTPLADLLRPYIPCDLRNGGIDTAGQEVTMQLDVQDVSDACAIIPVIEMA